MKIAKTSNLNDFDKKDPTMWVNEVDNDLGNIVLALQGRLRFGPNNSTVNKGENILGQFITYTTNGTPNTEDTVAHSLGSIPVGYIIVSKSKAGDIYQQARTGTAWSTINIYLKCTVASVVVTLFLIQ